MICPPCERQLRRRGRHRAHRGCQQDVIRGNVAGPCWCPACHWIPSYWVPPVMALDVLAIEGGG